VHDPGDELDGEGLDHVGDVDGPGSDTPAPERTHLPPVPGPSGAQSPTPSERRAILGTVSAAHGHLTADWLERQIDGDALAGVTSAMEFGGWGFTAGPEKVETSTDHVAEPKHDHELWHGNNDDDVDAEPDVGPMLDTGAVID
jgi:hypothetical protein